MPVCGHDDAGTGATGSSAALPLVASFIATVSKMAVTFAAVLADVSVNSIPFLHAHQHVKTAPNNAEYHPQALQRHVQAEISQEVSPLGVFLPCLFCDLPLLRKVRLVAHQGDDCSTYDNAHIATLQLAYLCY